MFAVSMVLVAAANLLPAQTHDRTPAPLPLYETAARSAADAEEAAQNLKLVSAAFAQLAAGDELAALAALDPKVLWRAAAARDVKPAADLSQRGAGLYLKTMAAAIRGGSHKLELLKVENMGDGSVRVISRWSTPGRRAEQCANLVQLAHGVITAVTERAM